MENIQEYIFLITSGSYSDYQFHAAFTDKSLAEKYVKSFGLSNNFAIERCKLNPHTKEVNENYKPYELRMTKEGVCERIENADESTDFNIWFTYDKQLMLSVFAKDEPHAIKIANEKRAQIIAANLWGCDLEGMGF
jgi:hypothetical protein